MDDTQPSKASDASATRKRRSSILKSQRPARTPFSELEFNVATPTDTAKSRRVSFSRRTGVAEFITHDATTTWKNFYEEHNKSLESSGNDSEANASKQPVGHLGKRIFDQQFEEVEAVDFISTLNPTPSANGSINNVNFTQQLASFECTVDGKLTAPQNKFELSALTDQHSKLFGNDFTVPNVGEMSGRIDVNFSALQQVGEKDDLDEIQRDIARVSNNMGCHGGPFSDRQNMSEYIEIDLNMTHVALRNEEDMSITDTVHSPVQDISKSSSIEKKVSLNKDWVTDKENIVVNPYAAPRESVNFAINDEPEQVLVFDGKRLTLQPDKPEKDKNFRQTLLPNSSAETPQRKTIVLNVNDDLPNFAKDTLNFKCENTGISGIQDLKSDFYNDDEVSTTLPVNRVDIVPKKKLILECTGNISMTQALPTNIITEKPSRAKESSDKRKTIVFDESAGNISVTQAIPVKLLTNHNKQPERRRTVVYEDDTGNISITQAVPTNIFVNESFEKKEKRKTIVFDEDKGNISVTQALSSNIIIDDKMTEKRKTIIFNDEKGNVSVTQALSSNILDDKVLENRKTIVFDNDAGNVSITQALPANIVLSDRQLQEKRRTIIYEDDSGNISVTQGLPSNLILARNSDTSSERRHTVVYEDDTGDISVTQAVPSNILQETSAIYSVESKIIESGIFPTTQSLPTNIMMKDSDGSRRKTVVYGDDTGSISITETISNQLIPGYNENGSLKSTAVDVPKELNESNTRTTRNHKQRTIVFDNDEDISMTEAIPADIIVSNEATNKRKTILFENDDANISMTQAIPTNVFLLDKLDSAVDQSIKLQQATEEVNENVIDYEDYEPVPPIPTIEDIQEQRKTVVVHADDCDVEMSITEAIPKVQNFIQNTEKRKTVVFDIDNGNISMTKPIPAELLAYQNDILNKSRNKQFDFTEQELVANPCPDVIVYQASTTGSVPKLQSNRTDQGDSKSERLIHSDTNSEAKDTSSSKVIDTVEGSVQESLVGSEDVSLIHPRVAEKSERWNLKPLNVAMDVDAKVADVTETYKETAPTKGLLIVEKSKDTVLNDTSPQIVEKTKDSLVNTTKEPQFIETPKDSVMKTDPQILETPKESAPNVNQDPQLVEKPKDSVLNTLLDMSHSSVDSGMADKNIMTQMDSNHSSAGAKTDAGSSESMFYITKDSDEEAQTDKEVDKDKKKSIKSFDIPPTISASPTSLQSEDEGSPAVNGLQKKLAELKTAVKEDNNTSINRIYEKIVRADLEDVVEKDENVKLREQSMTFRRANDTKELLEMISDFTDKKDEDENEAVVIRVKGQTTIESRSEINEPKRLSFATNRQSIALTREDILSNISMAQAALQKSRMNLDETDSIEDDTRDASMDQTFSKKSARTSNEVVKTLQFDDESYSESSLKSDTKSSPLKKTAFGETSYMTESKAKVIPTFLKDVSDGMKELMLDLVKPMTDNLPFDANGIEKTIRKNPSTQSMQIQANLISSSQVDMETDMNSNPESGYDIEKLHFLTGGALDRCISRSFKSPVKFSTNSSEKSSEFDVPTPKQRYIYSRVPIQQPPTEKVLVFDHLNPLNNILLGSMDYTDAHKYNPKKSDETLCGSEPSHTAFRYDRKKDNEYEVENITTQYRLESQVKNAMQGDTYPYKHEDQNSLLSNTSRPISIDQSIDVKVSDLKDNEANTLIAMKGNKELLEASSSLTLVDDAMVQQSDGEAESKMTTKDPPVEEDHHKIKVSKSPVKIIYKIEEQGTATEIDKKPVLTSQEQEIVDNDKKQNKAKKRIYSPTTVKSTRSPVDVTPKPITKLPKISNSPNLSKGVLNLVAAEELIKMAAEKDVSEILDQVKQKDSRVSDKKKSPRKAKDKKPGTNITVQQLITEYHMDSGINQNIIDKQILDALNPKSDNSTAPASQSDVLESNSLEVVSSFTSSKNLNAMKDVHSMSTTQSQQSEQSAAQNKGPRLDWHPELISAVSSNLTESESAVNVVAKIDMLPFMGSHECEWENSTADTWSFRLLHGRLRLAARLAHRHDNATRTRVRGDTPVLDVGVETVQHDKKNPVATLCVRFACETMRYMVSRASRGACCAGDIPPLLRRCAAVARVALRWGRAMHDAKLHLAYTLDNDGYLTLKVANIPLRSVWEVSMRVELVVDDAREAPWPRAGHVRVARVVSDVSVPEHDVRRALAHTPRDWGHAPRTIWRMFRYLKHKTRDDDLLL